MFGIGANELVIILIFGFIIFGPDKLPGMAKTIGQAIAKFRNAQAEMSKVIKTEVYDPNAEDPFKNPLDALSKLESQATKEDRGESFTQRKARYDKQRAAKKAAEQRKAELEAKKAAEAAAKEAALEAGQSEEEAKEAAKAAGVAAAAKVAEEAQASADDAAKAAKKKLSASELYGTKTVPAKVASDADEAAAESAAPAPTVRRAPAKNKAKKNASTEAASEDTKEDTSAEATTGEEA